MKNHESTFWFAALVCAALIFVGCESPTSGDAGAAGLDGPYPLSGATVSAAQLEAAFYVSSRVAIEDGSGGIAGEVPADKTLYVLGAAAKVATGDFLEVKGALDIYEAAALDASYISGASGYLKGSAAGITGAGTVSLPYLGAGGSLPEGGIDYTAGIAAVKAAGSYITSVGAGTALDNTSIATIFGLPDGPDELTVSNISGLTAGAVPENKTLTLKGTVNTISGNLDLSGKGTLIVAEGAELNAATYSVAGNVTNNGTIGTTSTTSATVVGLLALTGTGAVEIDADVTLAAVGVLNQNVKILSGKTLTTDDTAAPFSGSGKTITIESGGTLALDVANTSVGVDVDNKGTITTGTTSDVALATILGAGGTITASGAITALSAALTVPEDVVLTAANATFTTGAFAVTVDGTLTAASATFAAVTSLTVDGTLTAALATGDTTNGIAITVGDEGSATLGTVGKLKTSTVAGGGALTVTAITAFDTGATLTVSGEFTATTVNVTGVKAAANGTINGITFPDAVDIAKITSGTTVTIGDFTVLFDDTLTVPSGKVLVVASDEDLNILGTVIVKGSLSVQGGAVTVGSLASSVKLYSAVITGDATVGAVLNGSGPTVTLADTDVLMILDNGFITINNTAGSVVAGATTFSGVGSWEASKSSSDGDNVFGVKITSAAAGATIAAFGEETLQGTGTLTASGTAPAITQAAGADNALTIAANTTIDLKGTIASATSVGAIKLAESTTADEGGKLTFKAVTSTVKVGSETDGSELSATVGDFVTTAAAGKITVSSFSNVLIKPGTTTTGKVNTIIGTVTEGSLQAFGGDGGTGTAAINASTAASST